MGHGVDGFEEGVKELGGSLAKKTDTEFQTQYGGGMQQTYPKGNFYTATDSACEEDSE